MRPAENYTVAVFEKYLLYYLGIFATMTEKFGEQLTFIHYHDTGMDAPGKVENAVDVILFHIPLYMPFKQIKLLVKKIKAQHHKASIILYSSESRDDIAKNISTLDIKGSFLLEDSLEDITKLMGEALAENRKKNLMTNMN